jgi:hypothetical protein
MPPKVKGVAVPVPVRPVAGSLKSVGSGETNTGKKEPNKSTNTNDFSASVPAAMIGAEQGNSASDNDKPNATPTKRPVLLTQSPLSPLRASPRFRPEQRIPTGAEADNTVAPAAVSPAKVGEELTSTETTMAGAAVAENTDHGVHDSVILFEAPASHDEPIERFVDLVNLHELGRNINMTALEVLSRSLTKYSLLSNGFSQTSDLLNYKKDDRNVQVCIALEYAFCMRAINSDRCLKELVEKHDCLKYLVRKHKRSLQILETNMSDDMLAVAAKHHEDVVKLDGEKKSLVASSSSFKTIADFQGSKFRIATVACTSKAELACNLKRVRRYLQEKTQALVDEAILYQVKSLHMFSL